MREQSTPYRNCTTANGVADEFNWYALFYAIAAPSLVGADTAINVIEGRAGKKPFKTGRETPVSKIIKLRNQGLKWREIAAKCGELPDALQKRYAKEMKRRAVARA